jgi:hypothetical protein
MKISICFSGHIRNFFDKGLDNFNKNLLYLREQGHEVDLFFSVWDTYGPSTSALRPTPIESNAINEDLIKQMNPVSYLIEKYEDIKHNFILKNIHPTIKIEPYPIISEEGILYSIPMYYKIFSANSLKREYELKHNFKYDVVLRYRANIYMDKPLILEEIQPNTLYVPYVNQHWWENPHYQTWSYMTDDRFAYGDSEIMDQYSDTYNNLTMLFEKYKSTGPERILYNWLIRYLKLNVQKGINIQFIR